jgi:hypothetical protein
VKIKPLLCLAPILCAMSCHLAGAQVPGKTAPPAAKDAYVAAQLAKLFAGAPVHATPRGGFYNVLFVNISTPQVGEAATNTLVVVFLSAFDNELAARDEIRQELTFSKQPVASTKSGYDEFYSEERGETAEMIGRRGDVVVRLLSDQSILSNQPKAFERIFDAIATNLSANPALLPDLVHYAWTMHFGDTAPLRAALSNLNDKVPELSTRMLSTRAPPSEENTVVASYTVSGDHELFITAGAYDSEAAAIAGLTRDQAMKQVRWNKTQLIQGVTIYKYTRLVDFQVSRYTFELQSYGGQVDSRQLEFAARLQAVLAEVQKNTNVSGRPDSSVRTFTSATKPEDAPALLLKASSALITALAPPPK